MKESYDAIIIGAGVIGAAITLELARKGLKSICAKSRFGVDSLLFVRNTTFGNRLEPAD